MTDRQTDIPNDYEVHKCVVCNGFGTLKYGTVVCHACKGKGFITISRKTGLQVDREIEGDEYNRVG